MHTFIVFLYIFQIQLIHYGKLKICCLRIPNVVKGPPHFLYCLFLGGSSVTEARIFMKFYVVVTYYLVSLSFKFPEDLYPNARAGVVNARTRDKSCARAHLCTDLHKILNLRSQDSD